MALEQNKGSRRPHGEQNKTAAEKKTGTLEIEKEKLLSPSSQRERKAEDRHIPFEGKEEERQYTKKAKNYSDEKREGKRRIDHLDVLQLNSPKDIEGELEEVYNRKEKKKKSRWKKILLISVIEILTLIIIFCTAYAVRYMNIKPEVEFNIKNVKNQNIDVTKQEQMQGYWNIVVFGVDSRDGGVGRGANADVQIIVSIDRKTGAVKLASVFRDTYLNLAAGSRFAKINEAYADGGPEQAVKALNKNLDLDIEHYATFNWRAVADVISMLGGVDIDITDKEFKYMNAYIHETSIESKVNVKNPAAEYIKKPGMQHLDGVQAVAYARLRYMDDDFTRTKRQREVISQVLANAKKADLATLTNVIDTVLPQIAFNVDVGDILELAKGVNRYNIVGSEGFPYDLRTQMMGKKGDCVIPLTLASNVTKLHNYLFGDEDYKPSSEVWTFSDKIASDAQNYKSGRGEESTKKKSKHEDEEEETKEKESKKKKGDSDSESETKKKKAETDADGNTVENTKSSEGKSGNTESSKEGKNGKNTEESKTQSTESKAGTEESKKSTEESKKSTEESKKSEGGNGAQEPSIGGGPSSAEGGDDSAPGKIVD